MLYFVDFNDQEISFFENNLQGFQKEYIGLNQLFAINSSTVGKTEPMIVLFKEVTDEMITLLQKDSRIDVFLGWGKELLENEGSFKEDERYLGFLTEDSIKTQNLIPFLLRSIKNNKIQDQFLQGRIISLQEEMKKVVTLLEKEVLSSKKSYSLVREKLKKDFKTVKLSSLYKIGLNSGSEVNEILKVDGKLHWISFATQTYNASSDLLRVVEGNCSFDEFVDIFLKTIQQGLHKPEEIQAFLMEVDLKTLHVRGYLWGNYYFLSTNKKNIYFPRVLPVDDGFKDKAKFSFNLSREEKALLISPGVLKNFDGEKDQDELVSFCSKHIESGKEELLDELMLELKMKYNDEFFENDSFLTFLEVPPNAIISVN